MKKDLWLKSTTQIMIGVKLYYICSIIAAAFSLSFLSFVPVIGPLGDMAAGASVVGVFIFMFGAKALKEAVDPADVPAVSKLHTGLLLAVCAIFVDLIPVAGWIIAPIVNLVAFILMLLAYKSLKNSETLPAKAKEGASKLFIAMLIACVAAIVGIIPLIGGIISVVINIGVVYLVVTGWRLFNEEPEPATPVEE